MRGLVGRTGTGLRRTAALLATLLATASPVRAEDGGFFGFLSSLTGGGSPAPTAAPPNATPAVPLRPLTVRPTRKPHPAAARAALGRSKTVSLPADTGPVSIFKDPTLRDGDAVMTKNGMRVFAGGRLSSDKPFTESDFIAVPAARSVSPALRKTLTEINKLPHN